MLRSGKSLLAAMTALLSLALFAGEISAQGLDEFRIILDGKNVRQPEDYMAGQKIEDYDFYAKDLRVKDSYLGSFKLAPGKHTLRFEGVGRNLEAKGNGLGLDSIQLRERWNVKRKLLS